jgi:hypothetical protein
MLSGKLPVVLPGMLPGMLAGGGGSMVVGLPFVIPGVVRVRPGRVPCDLPSLAASLASFCPWVLVEDWVPWRLMGWMGACELRRTCEDGASHAQHNPVGE